MIRQRNGWSGLFRGYTPAMLGYMAQGVVRFGLYESYKQALSNIYPERSQRYKVWLLSSGAAELVATFFLAPGDFLRHRAQLLDKATFKPLNKESLTLAARDVFRNSGFIPFIRGLPTLWVLHVPFTMIQFTIYERLMEYAEGHWMNRQNQMSMFWQVVEVSAVSGFVGGSVAGLIVSPLANAFLPAYKGGVRLATAAMAGGSGTFQQATSDAVIHYFRFAPTRIILLGVIGSLQWSVLQGIRMNLTRTTTL